MNPSLAMLSAMSPPVALPAKPTGSQKFLDVATREHLDACEATGRIPTTPPETVDLNTELLSSREN